MLDKVVLPAAQGFIGEERTMVEEYLTTNRRRTYRSLIAIGDASQQYQDMARRLGYHYVCVDPHLAPGLAGRAPATEPDPGGLLLRRRLDTVRPEHLPVGPAVWIFHFNVFPYLDATLEILTELCAADDLIAIATWSKTAEASERRAVYDRCLERHTRNDAAQAVESSLTRRRVSVTLPPHRNHTTLRGRFVDVRILDVVPETDREFLR
ncbi:hypothetical protein ACIRL2_27320 [Embleya sp. NPDC127516]|uniref:hypothetical protein n=1 Tax=Embleya sp. NPDC127516 TaxID=3363990 RepID=UPI003829CD81